jgi:hypothetical protein
MGIWLVSVSSSSSSSSSYMNENCISMISMTLLCSFYHVLSSLIRERLIFSAGPNLEKGIVMKKGT